MIQTRRDAEIYEKEGGWFHARWHFSFDEYLDPEWMQFGSLRVFNDDRLVPGVAWPMHPHRDVEGITDVVDSSSTPTACGGTITRSCRRGPYSG